MTLEDLRSRISKASKGTHVSVMSSSEIARQTVNIATPAYDLNRILSGSLFRGIPGRSLSLFVGPETSGKSSIMCLCLAEAQKQGYTPVVIDSEGAWTNEFVKRWGMDPDNMLYIYDMWVDSIMVTLGQIIEGEDDNLALVLDSMGALESKKLIKDAVDGEVKADQGQLQRKIKRMLKMLQDISVKKNCMVMVAGHFYGSPGMYGNAEQVGGGFYAKLAPQIIVSLKKKKILDSNKNVIGNEVKAITLKDRFYPPFNEATVEIDYRKGINPYAGMLDLAIEAGLAEKGGGGWVTINGKKYQGEVNAQKGLKEDPEILNKIDEWLKTTGYSTINEKIKVMEESVQEEEPVEKKEPEKKKTTTRKKSTSKKK